jgi:hypothetical protein
LNEQNKSESHSGELRATEYEAGEVFEFGGHKLSIQGTSGPPAAPSRMAEGRPIQHDVMIAGQAIPARATSGVSQVESRVAAGQPVQHRPASQNAAQEITGSGQLVGGPVRRA